MAQHGLVSQHIKNLVQGVSQQPSFIRYPEQVEEQINGFSTEVDGLQKRPPSVFVKTLDSLYGKSLKPLVHFINRDAVERYVCVFGDNTVRIYDLEGNEIPVTIDDSVADYLKTNTPREDLQALTVADYTFVLNKTKKVTMSDKVSPDTWSTQGCIAYVKQGQYGRTYACYLDGTWIGEFVTPNGSEASHTQQIDTSYIAEKIASSINENKKVSGVTATAVNNYVHLNTTKHLTTKDGFNNQALIPIEKSIQTFSSLPSVAPDGYTVKVETDPSGSSNGSYYVKYDATESVWVECVRPNIPVAIDNSTMPHALVRESDGTFTFKVLEWEERKVGDEDSNPLPSFIDNTLSNIFFYRNRLGFSSKENVILSESASYFNMWMSTANDLLDTDCIDISVMSTKSNIINYVVSYAEDLYAFSNDTQFILRVTSVLSPKSASFAEITQFNSSPLCIPKVCGKNMYFTTARGRHTSLNEYYTVQDVSSLKNAQDVSAHIPSYIPNGVYKIIPSTIVNVLLLLTDEHKESMYVYKYLFSNESRVQSSWSKWSFNSADEIWGADFIGNVLYLVIKHGTQVNIEKIDFSANITDFDTEEKYRVFLDQKKQISEGVFDSDNGLTTFDIKKAYGYTDMPFSTLDVVTLDGHYYPKQEIMSDGTLVLEGNLSDTLITVGVPYTFKTVLSTFYIKENNGDGVIARTTGRTQLKYISFQYDKTGYFVIDVHTGKNMDYTYVMNSHILGTVSSILGGDHIDTGVFKVPVHAQNTETTVTIESSYPLALAIVGVSFECMYTTKTRGV